MKMHANTVVFNKIYEGSVLSVCQSSSSEPHVQEQHLGFAITYDWWQLRICLLKSLKSAVSKYIQQPFCIWIQVMADIFERSPNVCNVTFFEIQSKL